jgi:hypothetical protein
MRGKWYADLVAPAKLKTINLRKLPRPKHAIEIQQDVALRLDLKKIARDTFYKVDYLGRELIIKISKDGNLEVHELVEV